MTTGAFPLGGRIMRRRQQLTILALIVLLTSAVLDAPAAPQSGHNQISSVPAPNSKDSEAPAVFAISEMQPGTPVSLNLPAVTQATLFDGDYSYSIRVPSGVSQLTVALNWSTPAVDLDLWMRFGQDVGLANGRVVYDYKSTATSTSGKEGEIITVNSPAPGTYYIAASVFSGFNVSIAATITASMEFTGVIPQITVGDYGSLYSSTIEVINTTAGTINVSGTFYNENGTQSTVPYLTNISSVPSFTGTFKNISLASNAALVITVGNNVARNTDWAKIVTTGNVTILTFLEVRDATGKLLSRVAVPTSIANMGTFVLPRFRNVAAQLDSGFAIVNTGTTAANLSASLKGADGAIIAARSTNLLPNAHIAEFANTFFNGTGCGPCLGTEGGTATKYHFITFTSSSPQCAAMGLSIEGDILATIPVNSY